MPVRDTALGQVVGRELNAHTVAGSDTDEVLTHLARDMGQDLMLVCEFHAIHRGRQDFRHYALELKHILFLSHISTWFDLTFGVPTDDGSTLKGRALNSCGGPLGSKKARKYLGSVPRRRAPSGFQLNLPLPSGACFW